MRTLSYFRNSIMRPLHFAYTNGINGKKGMPGVWHAIRYGVDGNTGIPKKVLFSHILPALAFGFISRGREPKNMKELGQDMFMYNISWMIPIVGPAVSTYFLYKGMSGVGAPVYSKFLDDASKGIAKTFDLATNPEAEFSGRDAVGGAINIGKYFGIPQSIAKPIYAAFDDTLLKEGKSREFVRKYILKFQEEEE
jgi:hypothetical protein